MRSRDYNSSKSSHTESRKMTFDKCHVSLLQKSIFVPILPASSVKTFKDILDIYANCKPVRVLPMQDARVLVKNAVAHATVTAPGRLLTAREVNIMLQECGSICGLEEATRTSSGQDVLKKHLGVKKAEEVIAFWENDRPV